MRWVEVIYHYLVFLISTFFPVLQLPLRHRPFLLHRITILIKNSLDSKCIRCICDECPPSSRSRCPSCPLHQHLKWFWKIHDDDNINHNVKPYISCKHCNNIPGMTQYQVFQYWISIFSGDQWVERLETRSCSGRSSGRFLSSQLMNRVAFSIVSTAIIVRVNLSEMRYAKSAKSTPVLGFLAKQLTYLISAWSVDSITSWNLALVKPNARCASRLPSGCLSVALNAAHITNVGTRHHNSTTDL